MVVANTKINLKIDRGRGWEDRKDRTSGETVIENTEF